MAELTELIAEIQAGDLGRVVALVGADGDLVNRKDDSGATALHFAALSGQRRIARVLVEHGAEINAQDRRFGATPAGWAIEHLREMGGYLAIELEDFAFAITEGDNRWVARYLERFPGLRRASDMNGKPFLQLANEAGNQEAVKLLETP